MTIGTLYQKISFDIAKYHSDNHLRPEAVVLNPYDWEAFTDFHGPCYAIRDSMGLCGVDVTIDSNLPRGSFQLIGFKYHDTSGQPRTTLTREWVTTHNTAAAH